MKNIMHISFSILLLITIVFCKSNSNKTESEKETRGKSGLVTAAKGLTNLVLSPLQISLGILEGIASLPYYAETGLHSINEGLNKAQAKITLDDTYEGAYGKRLQDVNADGDTGEVFRRMKHATKYFQNILKRYGIKNYENYILTSIDTAPNYILFAVVHRTSKSITVIDKYDKVTIQKFDDEDRLFYEPYQKDSKGLLLDKVVDYGGIPKEYASTQKMQAVLLTIAANSVIENKVANDYWAAEANWIAGNYIKVMEDKNSKLEKKLNIK
ncbi:MAG: hypothetical protein SFU98_07985 [Leptospiraceae bacterium]|nr:hypothetical protein [Leptospiraceae bacterium]